ncbi:MAG: hypothetical protein ACQR33_06580 [Candidatus Saccharibacteria bacterium]
MIELLPPTINESILGHEIDAIQAFADTAVSLPPSHSRAALDIGRTYRYDPYEFDLLNYAATAINCRANTPNNFQTYYELVSGRTDGEFYAQTLGMLRAKARTEMHDSRNDVENDTWHDRIAEWLYRMDDLDGAEAFNDAHLASPKMRASVLGRMAFGMQLDAESAWPTGTPIDEILPIITQCAAEVERLRLKAAPWRRIADQFADELPIVDEWIEELAYPGNAHLSKAATQYYEKLQAELDQPRITSWVENHQADALSRIQHSIAHRSVTFYADSAHSTPQKDARADAAVQKAAELLHESTDNIPKIMKDLDQIGDGRETLILQGRAIKHLVLKVGVSFEEPTADAVTRALPSLDPRERNIVNKAIPFALVDVGEFGLAIKTVREDPAAYSTRTLFEIMRFARRWRQQNNAEPLVPIHDTLF